jgi:hypothetical protein
MKARVESQFEPKFIPIKFQAAFLIAYEYMNGMEMKFGMTLLAR